MLRIKQKTDVKYSETFSKDGSALNLTGYTSIKLYIFNKLSDTSAVLTITGTIADAANGIVNFEIDITDTNITGTKLGQYHLIDEDGELEKTDDFQVEFEPAYCGT